MTDVKRTTQALEARCGQVPGWRTTVVRLASCLDSGRAVYLAACAGPAVVPVRPRQGDRREGPLAARLGA